MTLDLLNQIGVETVFDDDFIKVKPLNKELKAHSLIVESDWSSASYYYSIVALSEIGTEITLSAYKESSLQGDSALVNIYKQFGVETTFLNNTITFKKNSKNTNAIKLDLNNSPDIAQTIAVTCLGLGIKCHLTGLHTLKIKETDRLLALKNEIEKLGGKISVTNDSLSLEESIFLKSDCEIATYNDHRMAMSFAPLALKTSLQIADPMVVSKPYPTFWDDLKSIGFKISK